LPVLRELPVGCVPCSPPCNDPSARLLFAGGHPPRRAGIQSGRGRRESCSARFELRRGNVASEQSM